MPIRVKFGARIKSLRQHRGWTQGFLAEMAGVEQQSISHFENGKVSPSLETIEKLASAFKLEPAVLLSFDSQNEQLTEKELCDMLKSVSPDKRQAAWKILKVMANL